MRFGPKFRYFNEIAVRSVISIGWILFVFLFIAALHAERLPVKTYRVADGLLRDAVTRIKQDSRGFMWFCTAEGASRFDGLGITNFTAADGLPDNSVQDFLETRSGTIYLATEKGLARLNPQGLRSSADNPLFTVILPDNPKAQRISTLFEDRDNQVWVGTSDGLYELIERNGQVTLEAVPLGEPLGTSGGAIAEPSPNTLYISAILEDSRHTLWIGTFGGGLFHLSQDGGIQRFTNDDELSDNKITALLETRDGRVWMGMRSDELGGVCILDPNAGEKLVSKCYTTKDGLPANRIRDMLESSGGQMWLATSRGLCQWQEDGGTVCKTYTKQNDLCDEILSLAEDKDGNLWTGSLCGAKKIARYGFTTYNSSDGLGYDPVSSIFENSLGELFTVAFPKSERVISRFDGSKFSLVKPNLPYYVDYHGWGWQQTVLQDSLGAWWIPTGYGLFRSPDQTSFDRLASVPLEKQGTGAKIPEIFRLFEDSRGDIWILTTGATNEFLHWERAKNTWHDYTSQVGFSAFRVGTALAEDGKGNIWVGVSSDSNESALIRYRNGEFRVLAQTGGAPSGWIRDLFLDSRGRLWIASTNDGVWRLDDPGSDNFEFVKYTSANGLTSDAVASVTEDEFGRIYIGSWSGIDRLNPDNGQIDNFTTADGLPASFVEISYRDRRNNLWFGTENGLARFVPEPPRVREPPNVLITGLSFNGESQSVSVMGETEISALELRPDQRQVTVDFVGLGASLGEKLKYEYRLAGSEWSSTLERVVNFANLGAGSYQLEIRAQTADRLYSSPATVAFRIASPIWQRWWFIAALLALTILLVYVFYRYRLSRLLELERMRTRLATDLHDDIGANLTRIALLSEVANQETQGSGNGKRNLFPSIANIARESIVSMNHIVWAISPDHDSLLDLTRRMRQHAEEVFTLRDIDLEFDAHSPDTELKLSVGIRRDVLLIFKEAVSNAAKYSNCTKVWIDFRRDGSTLILRIKDNGKGFVTDTESDGQGLRSMARRAGAHGGKTKIESANDGGTTVEVELSLSKHSQI